MQELSLNFPTVVILLVILALAVLAIRRMTRRGLCDCGDHCGDGEGGLRRLLPLRFGRSTDRFKPHQRHGCR